jgi:predicted phage tail protein
LTASAGGVAQTSALQLGTGMPTLSINATSIGFGDVFTNSPATQSVTLSSTGTAAVTVSAATVAGTGFSVSGATFPLTLTPNQTATLSVEFDPTAAGAVTGTLTITSNSSTNPTAAIPLSGTGETVQVNLAWDAPTSSSDPVAGYNVYRAPSGGTSYQQLNAAAITQATYVDTTLQAGLTYDYIVESVDASGNTSTPSNMASVVLP